MKYSVENGPERRVIDSRVVDKDEHNKDEFRIVNPETNEVTSHTINPRGKYLLRYGVVQKKLEYPQKRYGVLIADSDNKMFLTSIMYDKLAEAKHAGEALLGVSPYYMVVDVDHQAPVDPYEITGEDEEHTGEFDDHEFIVRDGRPIDYVNRKPSDSELMDAIRKAL